MKTKDVGTLLAQALAAHQSGRLADAERLYRRVLQAQPANPDALHLLGVVALQSGRHAEAVTSIRRALDAMPGQVNFWNSLAIVYQQQGDLPAEADAWAQVTALQPGHAAAWRRRGELAYVQDQPELACECLRQCAALAPNDVDVWSNLGVIQLRLWRLADAEASLRRALALQPDSLSAQTNLGAVLVADSRWPEALAALEIVTRRAPDDPKGWLNLGHTFQGLDRFEEALAAFDRALTLAPDLGPAMIGKGDAYQGLSDQHTALRWYEAALRVSPTELILHEHIAAAQQALGQVDAAISTLRHCLTLDPACDRNHSNLIFALDHHEGHGAAAWDERLAWNRSVSTRTRHLRRPHTNDRTPDRPLRVGYVSADYRFHSAGFAVLPVLKAHDRAKVRVYCYSNVKRHDQITDQARGIADVWHDVERLTDDELAALIRRDEIDILVDLAGHAADNRLPVFAQAPAPVQVTAWGYATGTGLETVQYFLVDPYIVPPDARRWYTEEIITLPTLMCYEAPCGLPPLSESPFLSHGHVTLGAFNRLEKISTATRETWARLLAATPNAHLVVKTGGRTAQGRQSLVDELVARGAPRDRITILGATPQYENLIALGEIDILLDTFPHGGGITSIEALLMGTPVVTMLGERVSGRVSASFLNTLGLDDLVARTPDAYIATVQRLAADREQLLHERTTLRERILASPMGDPAIFTAALEAVYRGLWQRWCQSGQTAAARTAVADDEAAA
ncbi:MAG: tetratricopeptide repeat protein [Chloroflexi bacterium]|nr:tetratricopeptide repeat protein [Chloroflexota bacterium]